MIGFSICCYTECVAVVVSLVRPSRCESSRARSSPDLPEHRAVLTDFRRCSFPKVLIGNVSRMSQSSPFSRASSFPKLARQHLPSHHKNFFEAIHQPQRKAHTVFCDHFDLRCLNEYLYRMFQNMLSFEWS